MARKYLLPDYRFKRLSEITVEDLQKLGVKAVAVDIDNTLAYDCQNEFIDGADEWVEKIKKAGFKLIIISNATFRRAGYMGKVLGIPYVAFAWKPRRYGFYIACKKLGIKPKELAVAGDQIYADVKGANKVGAVSIYVDPAKMETRNLIFFGRRRRLEKPVLAEFEQNHGYGIED
ncbi:MAG: YqeG family HAD IIIA-type phosphatase [Clostridiales bacterium]|nr:YqeG family HAD IIIA-type phosphatase [Clostridiales bacterium]